MDIKAKVNSQNIVAIIQARYASNRLPGKVLLDIAGKPMLLHVIDRVKRSSLINDIVVATTKSIDDDSVEQLCKENQIQIFRGSEFDVLDRFFRTAEQYQADIIVRITADCPLIDPDIMDETIKTLINNNLDFAANRLPPPYKRTYPIGLDVEVTTRDTLRSAWENATEKHEREHVMPYIYQSHNLFNIDVLDAGKDYGHLRWTVDTQEDLDFVREVYSRTQNEDYSWNDILEIIEKEPHLQKINQGVNHKNILDVDTRYGDEKKRIGKKAPFVTIFTAPKPFVDEYIGTIQRNAIHSWKALGEDVEIILVGDEEGIEEVAEELGVLHAKDIAKNNEGTPLVNSIFKHAISMSKSPIYAYVNADIVLLPNFLQSILISQELYTEFLLIGQRWDLHISEEITWDDTTLDWLLNEMLPKGMLHPPAGSDYFVFSSGLYNNIPPFAIGRAGWDNWMIFDAVSRGIPVVDCTKSITIIHQQHDYRHLPEGQPHYRLDESSTNVQLAGGKANIFTLIDATHKLENGNIVKIPITGIGILRSVERYFDKQNNLVSRKVNKRIKQLRNRLIKRKYS